MSTANALICAVLFYGFLVLLGRATIELLRYQSTPLETHAISPVIGLAVLTLLSTYLVLLGIPLDTVSKNMALSIAMLATIILKFRVITVMGSNSPLSNREYLMPLLITVLFITLPFIVGGYEFAILRGNGTDAFNYVTMADAISRFRIDWILSQTTETLSASSPSLPLAQELLRSRWSTSALLAFVSSAFSIAPIEFEHTFTLTLMVALFSAFVAALSAAGTLNKKTVWLPVVFIIGFWGQFTLDIRAFSQICSLPILVILIGSLLDLVRTNQIFRYGVALTSLLVASLFFQYPEITVAFLPGAGLVFIFRLWIEKRKKNLKIKDVWKILAVLSFSLLLCAPIVKFIVGFAIEQGRFAVNKSLGWEAAYFTWMKNPILGIWGVALSPGISIGFDRTFRMVAILTSFVLTLGLILRIGSIRFNRQNTKLYLPEFYIYIFFATGLSGALLLVARNNIWAAGKVLSYFSVLIPFWMAIYISDERDGIFKYLFNLGLSKIFRLSIILWGAIGFILAGARIAHAINKNEFPAYISQHGEYRKVNAGKIALIPNFNCPFSSSVAIFEPTVWGREFLAHLVEGRGLKVLMPGFQRIRSSDPNQKNIPEMIECALVYRDYIDAASLIPRSKDQSEYVVTPLSSQFVSLVEFQGGYGVEVNKETTKLYVWTGQQEVQLTMLSHGFDYVVRLKLCPGFNRGVADALTVIVNLDGKIFSQLLIRECTDIDVNLTDSTKTKLQKILINSVDPRSYPTLIGKDMRDLRLRVELSKLGLKK